MASVQYLPIDGEKVSAEWHVILTACRRAGVYFHVNEGHRTWARQAYLRALYLAGRGALAAIPSNNAPHIRTGRIDHAIDFNNAAAVIRWLHANGCPSAYLAVPGESWHVEVKASELTALAKKLGGGARLLKLGSRGNDVRHLQLLLRGVKRFKWKVGKTFGARTKLALQGYQRSQGLKADGVYGPATRRHLEADYYRHHPRPRS